MDNWLELLIPVVIVLLYLFQRLKGPAEEEEHVQEHDPRAAEEARRIQEEIRRKIVARQQGRPEEGKGPQGGEPVRFERFDEREMGRDVPPFSGPVAPPRPPPQRAPSPAAQPPAGGRDYQKELQEQLKRVDETSREKDKVAAKLGRERKQKKAILVEEAAVKKTPAGDLKKLLRDRHELRKSFVVKEVLSLPVSLRPASRSFSEFS